MEFSRSIEVRVCGIAHLWDKTAHAHLELLPIDPCPAPAFAHVPIARPSALSRYWRGPTTGSLPTAAGLNSGPVPDTIDDSLRHGHRGLPRRTGCSPWPGSSPNGGEVRNAEYPPRLTTGRIVKWAKMHRSRTGRWSTLKSGPIHDAPGETWNAVDLALLKGRRGLPGGSSLARRCGVRNPQQAPRLTTADRRPTRESSAIADAHGETSMAIHKVLSVGRCGLPGGSSLVRLLDERRPTW